MQLGIKYLTNKISRLLKKKKGSKQSFILFSRPQIGKKRSFMQLKTEIFVFQKV